MQSRKHNLVLILVITAAAHAPGLFSYFQMDDWTHLMTVSGPDFAPWRPGDWFFRPLFLASFHGLYRAFGVNAIAWHLVVLALHLVNVGLVYALVRRMGWGRAAACAGALAFGLYPPGVDAVGWISAFSGVVSAGFGLAAAVVALDLRMDGLKRGLVCCGLWTVALFFKEDAAGLLVVLPFVPMVAGFKRNRRDVMRWGAACALMPVVLWVFMWLEGMCRQGLGNTGAEINPDVLRRAVFILGSMTHGAVPPVYTSTWWSIALPALIPFVLWKTYPMLRLGILWFCGTGLVIGIALWRLAPQDRYGYIPAIGLALCFAALMERLSARDEPLAFHTRFLAAVFASCLVSIYPLSRYMGFAVGLAVYAALRVTVRPGADHADEHFAQDNCRAACLWVVSSAAVFQIAKMKLEALELVVLPPVADAAALVIVLGVIVLTRTLGRISGLGLAAATLCGCAAYLISPPGMTMLLVATLIVELAFGDQVAVIRPHRALSAIAVSLLVLCPWFASTLEKNIAWRAVGVVTERIVKETAGRVTHLPRGASVVIVDEVGIDTRAPGILQVTVRAVANRPDLRVRVARTEHEAGDGALKITVRR